MATRIEDRLGVNNSVGTAAALVAQGTSGKKFNMLIGVANIHASATAKLKLFIATSGWTTGEPSGGTLVRVLAYNTPLIPGEVLDIGGRILENDEQVVAMSDTAASLAVGVDGVEITP